MVLDRPLAPGSLFAERFEVATRVGAGGMGEVYRARDLHAGGSVALKLLEGSGAEERERFTREAALLASLSHPAIVRYVAHGTTPSGIRYLVMEWVDGETLAARLVYRRLDLRETVVLGLRLADALAEAHRAGVVHRDLKPRNVLLPDGFVERAKLIDFGIARRTHIGGVTRAGAVVGTPGYMAPEQLLRAAQVDARADLFALGCVLYECLAGVAAFTETQATDLYSRILHEEPPHLRTLVDDVPDAFASLVHRLLAKEPRDRPRTAGAVASELAAAAAGVLAMGADTLRSSTPHPPTPGPEDRPTVALGPAHPGARSPTPAATETPPPSTLRPSRITGAERRVLCVFVARKPSDPREAEEEASARERRLRTVVAELGALLEVHGDGDLVVTIAGDQAATDLAGRAARAALSIRTLLPGRRMALVMGRGVLGERGALGDVVDGGRGTAAASAPDEIRIDATLAGLLDARFAVDRDPEGREGGEGACWLRGEREVLEPARTLLGRPSPFVGRDRELATLEAVYDECTREPVARAVLVTGRAGAGKSRLRFEFLRRLRGRQDGAEVLFGRGDSLRSGSPFSLVAPALRRSAGILEGEPPSLRHQKLRARLGRHLAGTALDRATDFLGELVGVASPEAPGEALRAARSDPMIKGDAMLAAWLEFLEAETAANPLVLVLEDMHWGDVPTVKFVDAALRTLRERPLMVLGLGRPEVHTQFPGLFEERDVQEVRLPPLTRRASEALVRGALGDDVGPETMARVVARADGNAFYLEELVRALASGAGEALPETVLGMVQARLDRLGESARRVLRAASVFGQVFWAGGVAALLGGAGHRIGVWEWIEELVLREIIVRRGVGVFPGEEEFSFRHPLLREAAYAMLTEADRALGHRLAGEWLEGVGEADPIVLAEHFARGEEPVRAADWFRRGAEHALEGNDLAGTVERAERAIALGASGETLGAALLAMAEAQRWRGQYADGVETGARAISALARGTALWFRALTSLLGCEIQQGNLERVVALTLEGRDVRPEPGAESQWVRFLCQAGVFLQFGGQYEVADVIFEKVESLDIDIEALEPATVARAHHFRGVRALHFGDLAGHLFHMEQLAVHFRRANDMRGVCGALSNLGFAYAELGALDRAEETVREVVATADRLGMQTSYVTALANLASVLIPLGRLDEARAAARRAIAALESTQDNPRLHGAANVFLSTIALRSGDVETAEAEARAGVERLEVAPPLRAWALATLAQAVLARGEPEEARAFAEEAVGLADSLGRAEVGEAHARLVLAEVLSACGDLEGARRAVRRARDRLLERAGNIADPSWRSSFLERVPENARTLALAEEWG